MGGCAAITKDRNGGRSGKCPLGISRIFCRVRPHLGAFRCGNPKPGTLGLLIESYRNSAAFTDLAPRFRADYSASSTTYDRLLIHRF